MSTPGERLVEDYLVELSELNERYERLFVAQADHIYENLHEYPADILIQQSALVNTAPIVLERLNRFAATKFVDVCIDLRLERPHLPDPSILINPILAPAEEHSEAEFEPAGLQSEQSESNPNIQHIGSDRDDQSVWSISSGSEAEEPTEPPTENQ